MCLSNTLWILLGSGGITSRIHNLDAIWRWMVGFVSRQLCPRRGAPGTYWLGRLIGAQRRSGRGTIITLAGNWTPVVQPVIQSVCWLSYPGLHTHKYVICLESWNYRRLPQAVVSERGSDVCFIASLLLIGFSWPHNTNLCQCKYTAIVNTSKENRCRMFVFAQRCDRSITVRIFLN